MPVESRNLRKELKSGGGLEKCRRNLQNRFRLTIFAVGCYHRENIIIAGSTACNMIRRFIKYMHVSDLMLMRPSLSAFGQAACFTPPVCCNLFVYRVLCTFGVWQTSKAPLVVCIPVQSSDIGYMSSKNHSLYNHI